MVGPGFTAYDAQGRLGGGVDVRGGKGKPPPPPPGLVVDGDGLTLGPGPPGPGSVGSGAFVGSTPLPMSLCPIGLISLGSRPVLVPLSATPMNLRYVGAAIVEPKMAWVGF